MQRKRIHVDEGGLFAGKLNSLFQVCDFIVLASGQKHVNSVGRTTSNVVVQIHFRDVERYVLFSVPGKRFLKFLVRHLGQHNVLDDHRMTINTCGHSGGLDLVLVENVADSIRHGIQLHDLAVND